MKNEMFEHLKNMQYLYGEEVYVQIPNDIFKTLSNSIKNKSGNTNAPQASFAYAYVLIISLLYKYAHFVDIDSNLYIQNSDIKELLGYSRTTKSVDHIIKNGGLLDDIGLTSTTKDYPVQFEYDEEEEIDGISIRAFTTINDLKKSNKDLHKLIGKVVKNRNYEIKEPVFLFKNGDENGTLHDYSNTHRVELEEVLRFLTDESLDNIDMLIYFFLKSKCKGYKDDSNSLRLSLITSQLGIGRDTFYSHLKKIKNNSYVEVTHKGWVSDANEKLESNVYCFKGIIK